MERTIPLLQTINHCIYEDKLYGITEKTKVLISIDVESEAADVLDVPAFKDKVDYIIKSKSSIFAVAVYGKWIAEIDMNSNLIKYYDVDVLVRGIVKFSDYFCTGNKIVMLSHNEAFIYVFDMSLKTGKLIDIQINGVQVPLEAGYRKENEMHLYSGVSGIHVIYDMERDCISDMNTMKKIGTIDYIFSGKKEYYALVRNKIFNLDDQMLIYEIESNDCFNRACKAGDLIWILPRYEDEIYLLDLKTKQCRKYKDYPSDYEYNVSGFYSKFIGCTESEKSIFWSMKTNNYILCIDKDTGRERWLRPCIDDEAERKALFKLLHNDGEIVSEKICNLNQYIQLLNCDQ